MSKRYRVSGHKAKKMFRRNAGPRGVHARNGMSGGPSMRGGIRL